MLGREYFELWECGLCGTRHDERGKHNFTLAVEIPPMEDDGCGYSCPLLRSDEDGEYCRNGLELPADNNGAKVIKCRPGPGCPRWEVGPCRKSSSGVISYWRECAESEGHTTLCQKERHEPWER